MKVIMVMFDSLNRHFLPPYGCDWVKAPNFERLANRSVMFENCYAASMPCMPARRELHTGRYNFLHRSWGPLEPFDESLPELLREKGIYTHLVSDHKHYWEDGGATYHSRYNSWEIFRGQEGDTWKGQVADPVAPPTVRKMGGDMVRQDLLNRSYMQQEELQPQAQVFANGLNFIRTNHKENNWFLQIETFDPHEPFFTQQHYKDLYPHEYKGPQFDWPDYARVSETPEQVQQARYEYAALISMCDYYLGQVLDMMDMLQMWDDTMLIVCTDHGYLLGEHNWWAKNIQPWYNETVHTPLFIWDPRSQKQAESRQSLVQTIDIAPTILDFFNIQKPESMQGSALGKVITTDEPIREAGLFGAHGGHVNVTDGRYVYMRASKDEKNSPLFEYTLMPTHMSARFGPAELQNIQLAEPFSFTEGCRTMKIETKGLISPYTYGTMLFDLEKDPGQENPFGDEAIERRMIELMLDLMHANDAPPEQFERLGLPADGIILDEHLLLRRQHAMAQGAMAPQESAADLYPGDGTYNLDTPLKDLLAYEPTKAILVNHFPQLLGNPMLKMAESLPLKQLGTLASALFPVSTLKVIAGEFAEISAPSNSAGSVSADKAGQPESEKRIESLLRKMTLEEKTSMLAGANMWTTMPVERLGIPAIKVTDGPNGARGGGSFAGGLTSACFPAGISLSSTWNPALIEQVGTAIGDEAKTKGASILLGPTVNMHRSPLNGRNFECYSEDPYLSSRAVVAYIKGVQSKNVGATVKHFVGNDSEFERNSINSEIDERSLREIYLPPFQAAVKEARTWGVMAAYNRLNGTYASENADLLTNLLRNEWGFDGIVMSDWFGTKSTAKSVDAGLDLEMPGPAQWRGAKLLEAVKNGEVSKETIEESVRRLLRIITRAGAFENPTILDEQAVDNPEHRKIARQAATEGIVLLKNQNNVLPLNPKKIKKLAVIGPNAKTAQIMGGGSAQVNAHYVVTPFDGLQAKAESRFQIGYEIGCTIHKSLPVLDVRHIKPARNGEKLGFSAEFFNNPDFSGEPIWQTTIQAAEQMWIGEVGPGVDYNNFSVRLQGCYTAQESGLHRFSLISAGKSRLLIDGKPEIDNWTSQQPGEAFFGTGSAEVISVVELQAGKSYDLEIEYNRAGASLLAALRLGSMQPIPENAIEKAAQLAAGSDTAVLFVGSTGEWESEGFDRPNLELVGKQVALIEAVAAANPNTVVVVQTGSPIAMPWLDKVAGVLQAWFPGQECGNAIADVLMGDANPSGKLPQTFPVRLEDNPTYVNYPGENGKVRYGEGIFIGYRSYEKRKIAPLFPFGFGLSYTSFNYGNLKLSATQILPDDTLTVWVDITNTGSREGQEVVQLYLHDAASTLSRPEKELKAFIKVALQPGETKTVSMTLDKTSLAYFDDRKMTWVAEAGEFEALVGSSSQDIRAKTTFSLKETVEFGGPAKIKVVLSIHNTIKELIDNKAAAAILEKHFPGFSTNPQLSMAMGFTLAQLANMALGQFPKDKLDAIAADLRGESRSPSSQ